MHVPTWWQCCSVCAPGSAISWFLMVRKVVPALLELGSGEGHMCLLFVPIVT